MYSIAGLSIILLFVSWYSGFGLFAIAVAALMTSIWVGSLVSEPGSLKAKSIIALVFLLLKLLLVAHHEIVATPYDAWSYAAFADTPHFWLELGPEPGYPAWLWLTQCFGIPQRVGIELLLAITSFIFASGWTSRVAFKQFSFLYALLLFNPVSFYLFDQLLSEGYFSCLVIGMTGLIGFIFMNKPSRRISEYLLVALGLLLGLMEVTRRETPVTALLIATLFFGLIFQKCASRIPAGKAFRQSTIQISIVLLGVFLGPFGSSFAHLLSQGVWTTSIDDMPSHLGLLKRLAEIDTGERGLRFIPISRKARELAYAQSPTLARFRGAVEDKRDLFQVSSKLALGYPGEIGAGWIWHTFNATGYAMVSKDAHELDLIYRKTNDELDRAFEEKRLKHHFVLHPLIGADFSVWSPYLWNSAIELLPRIVRPLHWQPDPGFQSELFDRIALRRTFLAPGQSADVMGWAFTADRTVIPVTVEYVNVSPDNIHSHLAVPARPIERPDVQSKNAKEDRVLPLETGFLARVPIASAADIRLRFDYRGESVLSEALQPGVVRTLLMPRSRIKVIFGIDKVPVASNIEKPAWQTALMQETIDLYGSIAIWGILFAGSIVCLVLSARPLRIGRPAAVDFFIAAGVAMSWIVSRFVMYAILNAAAWKAESRYVLVEGVLMMALAGALLVNVRSIRAAAPT